jgi:hypothetical protein
MNSVHTDQRPKLLLAHFNQCLDVGYAAQCPVDTISLAFASPNALTAGNFSLPHDAVIRVYAEAGNVIGTHEHRVLKW